MKGSIIMFLLAFSIGILLIFLIRKSIKKYDVYFYGAAAVISLLLTFVNFPSVPLWIDTYILGLFRRGTLATALWTIVMVTGALPNGSVLQKQWLSIRGELSIVAAILTLCHNITYGKTYYVMLFHNPAMLPTIHLFAAIISVALLAIMIPLTIISFPAIRKKMLARRWKKIQKLAYVFYGLLYIHIMLVMLPVARRGNLSYQVEVLLYSVVFIAYAVCRVIKAIQKGKENQNKAIIFGIGVCVFAIAMAIVCWLLFVKGGTEEIVQPTEPAIELQVENTIPTNHEVTQPTDPEDTVPQTTSSAATEPEITENQPTESMPTDPKPTDPKPTDPKPTDPKPTESKPTEPKPTEPKPTESKPTEPKPTESKPTDPKPTESKPTEPKPTESKPTEPKPTESKPTAPPTEPPTEPPRKYKDGTFAASSTNDYETVTVSITIENDVITNVTAYSVTDTPMYFEMAHDVIVPAIMANQSVNVDTVSGATFSSNSIKDAADAALSKAKN